MPINTLNNTINSTNSKNIYWETQKQTSQSIGDVLIKEHIITSYFWDDVDHEIFISAIKDAIETIDKNEIYASWSEWEIFKIKIAGTNWTTRDLLVAKKRFDNKPDNEYFIHEKLQNLVQTNDLVQIPKLRWIFESKWYNYIVMDFVKWKTLYHKIAEAILKKKADLLLINSKWKNKQEQDIANQESVKLKKEIEMADSDAKIDSLFFKQYDRNREKSENAYQKRWWLDIKIFSNQEWQKYKQSVQSFLAKMHENWFYHRDLHEKNIIFWDDDKIYIIDFWKAFFKDPKEPKPSRSEIYEEQAWEFIWKYCEDESILAIIQEMTKTIELEEWEKYALQEAEKTKELTSWDMIIKQIDFQNFKSRSIISKIKKYFGWFTEFAKQVEKEEKNRLQIYSLLDIEEKDLLLLLFSQTKENLQYLLQTNIPSEKHKLLKQIKEKRNYKLWEQSRKDLFWKDEIDIGHLHEILKSMYNHKGYDYIYKNKGLDFKRDLEPMLKMAKELQKIQTIQKYLQEIDRSLV